MVRHTHCTQQNDAILKMALNNGEVLAKLNTDTVKQCMLSIFRYFLATSITVVKMKYNFHVMLEV